MQRLKRTDEQLEHLGGIEYRALRFLGYFVFGVSVKTSYHRLSLITHKHQVFCCVQPYTIPNYHALAADQVHIR